MKKFAIAIILFCTLYSAYSLDYRQVIFGNSYKNIIEIDADAFFEQYPAVKQITAGSGGEWVKELQQSTYARVYEQIIGKNTFYRVLFSNVKLTEADFLDWKEICFSQYVFFKKSDTDLLQIGDSYDFGDERVLNRGTYRFYNGLEIIERNNQVIGIMQYYYSSARYSSWQNIVNAEEEQEESPTISYTPFNEQSNGIEGILITASNSLVDSKRPFMYTIQNAFDGNPATSYVENTEDDMFLFEIWRTRSNYSRQQNCTGYMIINGYASGDYYYQNNQIAKVSVGSFSAGYINDHDDALHGRFHLNDTVKPQVMNFEAMITFPNEDYIYMEVEGITKGTLYNDTAIAEFDIYFEDEGWLFGLSDTDTINVSLPKVKGYEYTLKDGTAEIVRYTEDATELTIPSIIKYEDKTYPVTSIGDSAFEGCYFLTSVTIPNSVTSIGGAAFYDCNSLTTITIPDSVTTIGRSAFEGCYSLTKITIPNSVTSLGGSAFARCHELTTVSIPNSVTSIGSGIFFECFSLTSISIPDSVTSIEDATFMSCSKLTSITIPDSVTSIGDWAFPDNENLTLSVYQDSYALEYAKERRIPYILVEEE